MVRKDTNKTFISMMRKLNKILSVTMRKLYEELLVRGFHRR